MRRPHSRRQSGIREPDGLRLGRGALSSPRSRAVLVPERPRNLRTASGERRRAAQRGIHLPPQGRHHARGHGVEPGGARSARPRHGLRGDAHRYHRTQEGGNRDLSSQGACPGHLAIDRRRGHHHRLRRAHRLHEPGRRKPDRVGKPRSAGAAHRRRAHRRR